MAESLEVFCGGSTFWDEKITWNTTNPDFPECFQKTVLVWVPCGFLWILSPIETHYLLKSKNRNIPWTGLNITKLVISILLIILTFVEMCRNVHLYASGDDIPSVDFYSPFIKFVTFLLATIFIFLERRRGLQTTGILFLFWFLLALAGLVAYRTCLQTTFEENIIEAEFVFVFQMIYFPLVIAQLVLSCLSDASPRFKQLNLGKNTCPEQYSSFVSRMIFSWFDRMALKGYRRPLERSDLWSLQPPDQSKTIINNFDKYWQEELRKSKESADTSRATYNGTHVEVDFHSRPRYQPSILKALVKSFGPSFAFAALLKLFNDLLTFVSPMVLEMLITFASGNEPIWKGYFYAGLIFGASFLQSIILGQYFKRIFLVGMRLRSAVISAVYRKAMRLSNSAKRSSTVGEIVNLMSVDAQRFMDLTTYLNLVWSAPLQISLAMYFLWNTLGPSVLTGVIVMILLIPINGVIANKIKQLQVAQMKNKDERVKLMNEILNGIKVLKLYAWELSFSDQVLAIRNKELEVLKKSAYLNAFSAFLWMCAPFLVMLSTFTTYVLIDENNILDPSKAFVSLSLFNILRMPMAVLPMMIVGLVQAAVSLKRMNKFMSNEELDTFSVTHHHNSLPLVIESGTFSWGADEEPVLKNINLNIDSGSLVAIVGPVGAGKSSLLSAFLGEMEKLTGKVNTLGKIAYVPQQAWIQNISLKDNIVFSTPLDDEKYTKIVDACALVADIEMLPGGDETEIGEKGINLSGGQKQRVSLARAVYSDADVFFLDDPLSAVDSHVGKHIFDKVISRNGILKGKTRILVTHNVTYLPEVDHIIVLSNGAISEMGSYKDLLDKKGDFAEFLMTYLSEADEDEDALQELKEELISKLGPELERRMSSPLNRTLSSTSHISDKSQHEGRSRSASRQQSVEKSPDKQNHVNHVNGKEEEKGTKLVKAETAETGQVKMKIYSHYFHAIGMGMAGITLALNMFNQGCSVGSNIWLSAWSNDKPINGTQDPELRDLRLGIYGLFGFLQALFVLTGSLALAFGTIQASLSLHTSMLANILRSPMSFFDTTPIGRIVNRFAKDVDVVDNTLPMTIRSWLNCFLSVIATLVVISISTPIFMSVIAPIGILYYFIQKFYVSTSRQLKRLESVSRSPIYSHFSESLNGASTIRAYDREKDFVIQSQTTVDDNQICYYPSIISNRWLAIRLEIVGSIIVFSASLFAVLGRESLNPGIVGLSVSYALSVTATLNWMVRMSSELETNIVAVERLQEYTESPQEASWDVPEKKPPKTWPQNGIVKFDNYATRYRDDLELVLHGISCNIEGGEKVGIVGRTGAGKSSLTLALFRIIESAGGRIVIDDIDIAVIGLHDLRGHLTIIPQDPVLFSGTLRMNLDPFDVHSDEEVWKALEQSHLKVFIKSLTMGLLHEIAEGGENLSVGQRQLVCLARALLRKTKVLVLDEATAAVDMETDDLIQATIRKEFANSTVLTIAHRLNTIMDYNRVIVLERGKIVEFDTPSNLLQNTKSVFYGMARDAGLV